MYYGFEMMSFIVPIIVILVIVGIFLSFVPLGLWISAVSAGVKVSIFSLEIGRASCRERV